MSQPNLPSLRSVLPPAGIVYFSESEQPLLSVYHDLCKIAAFFQNRDLSLKFMRYDDWWEHDGLLFDKEIIDFHSLFNLIGSPRSILQSMPGDHRVFVAFAPEEHSFYLRFFADWDDRGVSILGEYSITMAPSLLAPFQNEVLPKFTCRVEQADAAEYFSRIQA